MFNREDGAAVLAEEEEIVQEFLVESRENLDQLDRDLIALEQDPSARELLASVFRTIHTIKGTSGFLAFNRLESLTHVGENLLARLRDGELTVTPDTTDALLQMVDCVRALLAAIAATGGDADAAIDVDSVVAAIEARLAPGVDDVAGTAPEEPQPVAEAAAEPVVEVVVETAAEPVVETAAEPVVETVVETVVEAVVEADADAARAAAADPTVRVDVELLDTLVQLVGELVLTRNQILQQSEDARPEMVRATQRLDLVASELQESVMKTRMQPIANVWSKMPRVVRDLGNQLGRRVRLVMEGQETELDRSLLEAVKDPLTHLVRNAIDHGIETPEDRRAAGKPDEGTLLLRAYHESGQVIVEISDDGAGIDPDKIARAAAARGVIGQDALGRMDQRQLIDLIFRPGFSTAAAVTNVSGRGVGMDVVRTNIERIGGTVDVASVVGEGTTFRVRIPLTLAIIPALLVEEAGERYAIPQANLVELVRLDQDNVHEVESLAGAPVLRLRGRLLPLVSMSSALGVEADSAEAQTVVVVQAGDTRFGLCVGMVHDTQEIVVKPLGRQLKTLPLFAGATIMGDGNVALILDVVGVAASVSVAEERSADTGDAGHKERDLRTMLILDVDGERRAAMPLDQVARLEEFDAAAVERSGSVEVVQYRDGILPLVRLAPAIGVPRPAVDPSPLPVIVHGTGEERIGIVVHGIVDVVETSYRPTAVGERPGVEGSAVVQGRVTDIVDLPAVVASLAGRSA